MKKDIVPPPFHHPGQLVIFACFQIVFHAKHRNTMEKQQKNFKNHYLQYKGKGL